MRSSTSNSTFTVAAKAQFFRKNILVVIACSQFMGACGASKTNFRHSSDDSVNAEGQFSKDSTLEFSIENPHYVEGVGLVDTSAPISILPLQMQLKCNEIYIRAIDATAALPLTGVQFKVVLLQNELNPLVVEQQVFDVTKCQTFSLSIDRLNSAAVYSLDSSLLKDGIKSHAGSTGKFTTSSVSVLLSLKRVPPPPPTKISVRVEVEK